MNKLPDLEKSKEILDYEIEGLLYKRCMGYYAKENKVIKCRQTYYDEKGRLCERKEVKIVEVDRFIPPDTIAIALWLTNRKPSKWKIGISPDMLKQYYLESIEVR